MLPLVAGIIGIYHCAHIGGDGTLWNFCPGCSWTAILQISTSWIDRIIGLSQYSWPAYFKSYYITMILIEFVLKLIGGNLLKLVCHLMYKIIVLFNFSVLRESTWFFSGFLYLYSVFSHSLHCHPYFIQYSLGSHIDIYSCPL
jgi:hypothetical protein